MGEPNAFGSILILVGALLGLIVLVGWICLPFIVVGIRNRIDNLIDQQQAILSALRQRDGG